MTKQNSLFVWLCYALFLCLLLVSFHGVMDAMENVWSNVNQISAFSIINKMSTIVKVQLLQHLSRVLLK